MNEPLLQQKIENSKARPGPTVTIRPLNYGYLVLFGCVEAAFDRLDNVMDLVEAYLDDPEYWERAWKKKHPVTPMSNAQMASSVGQTLRQVVYDE